jgi:hypothetical protein
LEQSNKFRIGTVDNNADRVLVVGTIADSFIEQSILVLSDVKTSS